MPMKISAPSRAPKYSIQAVQRNRHPWEIINEVFGGKDEYEKAIQELEQQMYGSAT